MSSAHHRDIIVVGASMGGVEALSSLAGSLPADLAACVLVVQHTAEQSPGLMGEILARAGPLPARLAEDGEMPMNGRIYVAPPDHHLLLTAAGLRIAFGPRENRARPAIDPLFRTAAVNFRSRVIGVVLTGLQGDGAAGLLAVEQCGGAAVVQSPEDAAHPEMPRRALAAVPTALQAGLAEMGPLLARLAREPAPPQTAVPEPLMIEARLTERAMKTDDWRAVPSRTTDFTCPECAGALREIDDERVLRYRCRVGHAYSADDLVAAKGIGVEEALWIAMQTLEERTQLLQTMAEEDRRRGWDRFASGYDSRAGETRAAADRLRALLGSLTR
jgi:two-component system, chemotaxis family, protein-glutamate methylesterase/glutaminase